MAANGWSKTWTFYEGDWHEGNIGIVGPRTHALWLASSVFDGARAFEGVTPDLDLHCERINNSAPKLSLKPLTTKETWLGLVADGMKRFDKNTPLYIRPMYWAEHGATLTGVSPDPESTRWCLCLYETPMPPETAGLSITLSPFRRPTIECMPVDAKAGCLYPNNGRALVEANARGFDNCLLTRHARQCRGACDREHLLRQGRRRVHAGRERHVPLRHHAPPHHQADARCGRDRGRRLVPLFGLREPRMRFSPPATTPS